MNTTHTTALSIGQGSAPPSRAVFSYDAIYKLPRAARYFNISVLWIAYFPHLTRLLYALRIRHEVVTLISMACGLSAAAVLVSGQSMGALILSAILIHLKDVFDACDGSLARLTGTGHRIGRFLDTIGDGVVFTALIAAVGWIAIRDGSSITGSTAWAGAAWLSLFLQCSYFNYYHLRYTRVAGATSVSRLDEQATDDDTAAPNDGFLLGSLHAVYLLWFGWQDRLIHWLDRKSLSITQRRANGQPQDLGRWYAARRFLVANSALCYGTHAFVLILCLLVRHPAWFFPAVVIGMNFYFATVVVARVKTFGGAA